jgi:hypothetical protein
MNAKPAQHEAAYFVQKIQISLPSKLPGLLFEVEESHKKCAAFRKRYDDAESQLATACEARAAILATIAEMGSQAAAVEVARFMGVAGEPVKAEADLALAREELAAVDREIDKLENVTALAPSLFPPLVEELETKRAALEVCLGGTEAIKVIEEAAAVALAIAERIAEEARFLKWVASGHGSSGPRPVLKMVDEAVIDEWLSAQFAPLKAREQMAPLVARAPERPKSIGEAFKEQEERAQRQQASISEMNERSAREGAEWRRKIERAKLAADNAHASKNPQAADLMKEVRRLEAGFEEWRKGFNVSSARAIAASAA